MFEKGEVKASTFTPDVKTENRKKREKEKQEELDMNIHST